MNSGTRRMSSILFVFILVVFSGSCANYNSNSNDADAYRVLTGDPNDPNFEQAFNVLDTKCIWCHPYHDYFSSLNTSQKWVDTGQVVKGNPDNSTLIRRLRRFGNDSNSNMPIGADITDAEYQILRSWIENIP